MPKKKYTAEFKTKVILTIIQGDKEFNAICADFNLNPAWFVSGSRNSCRTHTVHLTQILSRKQLRERRPT